MNYKPRFTMREKVVFAKEMRKNPTPAEAALLSALKKYQIYFKSQEPIFGYIADFYFPGEQAIVEVDGEYHKRPERQDADSIRDRHLKKKGIKTLRVTNEAVLEAPEATAKWILQVLQVRPVRRTHRKHKKGPQKKIKLKDLILQKPNHPLHIAYLEYLNKLKPSEYRGQLPFDRFVRVNEKGISRARELTKTASFKRTRFGPEIGTPRVGVGSNT